MHVKPELIDPADFLLQLKVFRAQIQYDSNHFGWPSNVLKAVLSQIITLKLKSRFVRDLF